MHLTLAYLNDWLRRYLPHIYGVLDQFKLRKRTICLLNKLFLTLCISPNWLLWVMVKSNLGWWVVVATLKLRFMTQKSVLLILQKKVLGFPRDLAKFHIYSFFTTIIIFIVKYHNQHIQVHTRNKLMISILFLYLQSICDFELTT